MAISIEAQAQNDSTSVSVGYSLSNARTTAGAVDQVTRKRMNKGLVTNSLEALNAKLTQNPGY